MAALIYNVFAANSNYRYANVLQALLTLLRGYDDFLQLQLRACDIGCHCDDGRNGPQ